MPFEILTEEENPGEGSPIIEPWRLGEPKPEPNTVTTWLMATGQELDYIRAHFLNIPITANTSNRCVWSGEMARFIFDNLDWETE